MTIERKDPSTIHGFGTRAEPERYCIHLQDGKYRSHRRRDPADWSHAVTNAGTFATQVDNTVTVASHNVTNAGTLIPVTLLLLQNLGTAWGAVAAPPPVVVTDDGGGRHVAFFGYRRRRRRKGERDA